MTPEGSWKWRCTHQAHSAEILFGLAPPLFGCRTTISRFGECFRDGQYSLVSFLFAVFYSRYPRSQPFVKVGARAPVPRGVGNDGNLRFVRILMNIFSSLVKSLHYLHKILLSSHSCTSLYPPIPWPSYRQIVATSIVHSKLDYPNFLYYGLLKYQINRLHHTENVLVLTVFQAPKLQHIMPVFHIFLLAPLSVNSSIFTDYLRTFVSATFLPSMFHFWFFTCRIPNFILSWRCYVSHIIIFFRPR